MELIYPGEDISPPPDHGAYERCEQFALATGAIIHHHAWEGGGVDYGRYDVSTDQISLLEKSAWKKGLHYYYSTMFHELMHWTGANVRMNRPHDSIEGDLNWTMEELIAEYGARYLSKDFGVYVCRPSRNASIARYWARFPDENAASIAMNKCMMSAVEFLYSLAPQFRKPLFEELSN